LIAYCLYQNNLELVRNFKDGHNLTKTFSRWRTFFSEDNF